ncbi:hypothetical protein Baya_10769 [Bagarius yarrelli]|uniref:Uncharacterized protein n=1 Tax=Bagarius yarrelli TaxID=175774 RepID=A0A556UZA5_BAGYA|nr:hypothetical protein Baya_10769 [Bagarius yarrelli]
MQAKSHVLSRVCGMCVWLQGSIGSSGCLKQSLRQSAAPPRDPEASCPGALPEMTAPFKLTTRDMIMERTRPYSRGCPLSGHPGGLLAFDNWVAGWVSRPLTRIVFSAGLNSRLFDNGRTETAAWHPFVNDVNRRR